MPSKKQGKVSAVIPARANSKGLPGKNYKMFCGKPLIQHSIEAALDSNLIDRVIVSTDSEQVKKIIASLEIGDIVVRSRPKEFAGDSASMMGVVQDLSNASILSDDEYICLLQPTSPLRTSIHIDACLRAFFDKENARSSMSIVPSPNSPFKMLELDGPYLAPFKSRADLGAARQSLPPIFVQNGAIYVASTKNVINEQSFFHEPCLPFLMVEEESVDIDTEFDWIKAELLAKAKQSIT